VYVLIVCVLMVCNAALAIVGVWCVCVSDEGPCTVYL